MIGAKGYNAHSAEIRVSSYAWDSLDEVPNLRDFDVVILDLLSVRGEADYESLGKILDIHAMTDILNTEGTILVLGDPRPEIHSENSDGPFLDWTGISFDWDDKPGDTIELSSDWSYESYQGYLQHLKRWDYALRGAKPDEEALQGIFNLDYIRNNNLRITVEKQSLAWNRYREDLAFSVNLAIEKLSFRPYSESWENQTRYSQIIFLPKVDVSEDEALVIVLRDICGVEVGAPEPEWLSSHVAPGQEEIDSRISEIRDQIAAKRAELDAELVKRDAARDCLKLLYEKGQPLEVAVRSALRELGAGIEEPQDPGKEDGWVTVTTPKNIYEGVLEVKGTKNEEFDEYGMKQLLEWINRGVQLRRKKYKGIFVGNNSVEEVVGTRKSGFSDGWKKSAELHNITAIRSEDLYRLYVLKKQGLLDARALWEKVFSTNGIFDANVFYTTEKKAQ
ncbi:MAG: hypothetical protein ABSA78_15590 [Candidatus Sulfotelmatobacter sp.]